MSSRVLASLRTQRGCRLRTELSRRTTPPLSPGPDGIPLNSCISKTLIDGYSGVVVEAPTMPDQTPKTFSGAGKVGEGLPGLLRRGPLLYNRTVACPRCWILIGGFPRVALHCPLTLPYLPGNVQMARVSHVVKVLPLISGRPKFPPQSDHASWSNRRKI